MAKNSAITVRLSDALKRRLEAKASSKHRSLSAQVVVDLENAVEDGSPDQGPGRFLGLYEDSTLPTDEDISKVRRLLWGRLDPDG